MSEGGPIDLRSDTVTRPTAAMRRAMAAAQVGDDVYGEDPTVTALEERIAELLGKPAGLFVSSGTMGNQLALLCHTSRGDEVYAGQGAHCVWYESGAAAAWSGVQVTEVGQGGVFTAAELESAVKPRAYYSPNPKLCVIENTHNRGGGCVFPSGETARVAAAARRLGLGLHLDGARLWNASIASGQSLRDLAEPFDTISICFSKGLGAPVGSALVGDRETIVRAHRFRKMLGGGMRQVGVLAAAALHAVDHHVARLADDHENARRFADALREQAPCRIAAPETNIVMVDLDVDAGPVVSRLKNAGVLVSAFGPRRLRVVTHLDVTPEDVGFAAEQAAQAIRVASAEATP